MNSGTYRISETVPYINTLTEVVKRIQPDEWVPTIADGPYSSSGWRVIKLIENGKETPQMERYPEFREIARDHFKCHIDMLVLYSTLPGAQIHSHRDLSGTLEFGRLRFHVPIVTNPNVEFKISHKRVIMGKGELWALNTSYIHAVHNKGDAERIHMVLGVDVNPWCWSLLPKKTVKYYAHSTFFMAILAYKGVEKLVTHPKSLGLYVGMVKNRLMKVLGRSSNPPKEIT